MNHPRSPGTEAGLSAGGGTALPGTLYVVATPIGNLGDVTLRALEVLRSVDVIAAEDTRITSKLLNRHGVAGRLIAVHEHNERRAAETVAGLLAGGKSVALVSDAGTPGIADPGARVVAAARAAGHVVVPVPGANAAAAALSASGFEAGRFLFCGFLPSRAAERRRVLGELAGERALMVFYEAPHRIKDCVADLCAVFGGAREVLIARELTKLHETLHRCRLEAAGEWLQGDDHRRRGEFVLVVEGAPEIVQDASAGAEDVLKTLLGELPLKQAVALAVKLTGGNRNELYGLALKLKGEN
ncbi:MAG: 16S rRNA (cytidine(1402)-2'-O)-methyltransferase [Burkholderiales bacterium]|nr:16S rRNA (cytidine(1402)-2'-O)-methyltransferase [Burkholderiales bacterium]